MCMATTALTFQAVCGVLGLHPTAASRLERVAALRHSGKHSLHNEEG